MNSPTTALARHRTPLALLVVGFLAFPGLVACHSAAAREARLVANTQTLPHTDLVLGLEITSKPEANQFWCASMAFAWQALSEELGIPLTFLQESKQADWLSACPLRAEDLESGTVFTSAGRGLDALGQLKDKVAEAGLEWEAEDQELADMVDDGNQMLFAYARLEKDLPFAKRFEDFEAWAIPFRSVETDEPVYVDAFGLWKYDHSDLPQEKMAEQVRVHHYTARGDFVVELVPEGGEDRIIIARLTPGKTLRESWDAVTARLTDEPDEVDGGDTLAVPELSLRLIQSFPSLAGLELADPAHQGMSIGGAVQDLDLRLDEEGMRVRSRALLGATAAAYMGPREMICDGPFLIATMEADDTEPYFVAWIGHPEVLLPQAPSEYQLK